MAVSEDEILVKLKALPQPEFGKLDWSLYADLNFTKEDVDELIGLAEDFYLMFEQSDEESAVCIHAWRSAVFVGDVSLVSTLLMIALECDLIEDEWFAEDFSILMAHFGMSAFPALLEALASNLLDESVVSLVCNSIPVLGESEKEKEKLRAALVGLLVKGELDRDLRANLVNGLVMLKAVEAIDTICSQFEANQVNVAIVGDLEEVELALGLRSQRATPKPDFHELERTLEKAERRERAGCFPTEGDFVEKLQYFLISYGSRRSLKGIDELDGFLLSSVISGGSLPEEKLACFVWDPIDGSEEFSPNLPADEKKEWLSCLEEFVSEIMKGLTNRCYQPKLSVWPDAEESMDPEAPFFTPWLNGFLGGEIIFNSSDSEDSSLSPEASLSYLAVEISEAEEAGLRLLEDDDDNPFFAFMAEVQLRFDERGEMDFDGEHLFEEMDGGSIE